MSKRILIFNWRDTRHLFAGGAEVYLHELAKRWVRDGHKVTLFCGNDRRCRRHETIDGVHIVRRGGFYTVYIWAFLYYWRHLRGKYDVILDCQNGVPFFSPLYAKEKVVSLMFHVHQDVFRATLSRPLAIFATFLEQKAMPFVYRNSKFITISESTKKGMEEMGLGKRGIDIIYPGVDLDRYAPGVKSKAPLISYVGRLKKYKRVDLFLQAAAILIKEIPTAKFLVAGRGEEQPMLKKMANDLGISQNTWFLGHISEEEKLKVYHRSWVCINPSMMEGWGITTIEANACGTPVVASDVPGLRESVVNNETGILVDSDKPHHFADALRALIHYPEKLLGFERAALSWSKGFEWNVSANKMLEFL